MNEEYIANAERRRKIADDMAWSSGYASGYAAGRAAARAALLAELEAEVERLPHTVPFSGGQFQRSEFMVNRAAVLDLIHKAGQP